MRQLIIGTVLTSLLLVAAVTPAFAGQPARGTLWLDGEQVRTLVLQTATPQEGRDPLYLVPGTGGVAGVGPGDRGYHGGDWAVHLVSWNVEPYLLTSKEAVLAAASAGDVTITRNAEADFRCPIQP